MKILGNVYPRQKSTKIVKKFLTECHKTKLKVLFVSKYKNVRNVLLILKFLRIYLHLFIYWSVS